ncbi:MAG TPA: FAD/NAD(P)-binding oxidoreductase [Microthrixaceae bacterium]|nr:FAD/NAD(P)-binding oxidoreductase [Microthrixaceae bacterium]
MAVLIAGASLAGLTAAEALRAEGFDGDVIVVDPSTALPPDRPPLSKQVLSGEWPAERAQHRLADKLSGLNLDLRLGVAAVSLDAAERVVGLSDGTSVKADGIVIATGSSPRRLPGPDLLGVHVLRDLEDCIALRNDLDAGPSRVAVIGAGFIGAEVAATCRSLGLDVTMIEAGPVPLGRVLPGQIGSFIADLHTDNGVEVRLGVGVSGLTHDGSGGASGDGARVTGVEMADGSRVEAEVVVVGIGVTLNTEWLEGSGLTLDNGVVCDETCLAAPGIVAAGDLATWHNHFYGQKMRVEQWENAIEQGEHAAKRLLAELGHGEPTAFRTVPWFWSDQYDLKMQMAGMPSGTDEVFIPVGSLEERRFVAMFRRGDKCSAVLGVSRPRQVMLVRMKLRESLDWDNAMSVFA